MKTQPKTYPIADCHKFSYGKYNCDFVFFQIDADTTARVAWDENHDWDYYSKSYGYPKSTYDNRRVDFIQEGKVVFTYYLDSFAGNFLEKAIIAFKKPRKNGFKGVQKKLQLTPYHRTTRIRKIVQIEIHERTIGGVFIDFVAYHTERKVAYHGADLDQVVSGLRNKIRNSCLKKAGRLVTKKTGLDLGFCEPGMRQWCSLNGLDYEGSYDLHYIREVVQKNPEGNATYRAELRQVGVELYPN